MVMENRSRMRRLCQYPISLRLTSRPSQLPYFPPWLLHQNKTRRTGPLIYMSSRCSWAILCRSVSCRLAVGSGAELRPSCTAGTHFLEYSLLVVTVVSLGHLGTVELAAASIANMASRSPSI